jgi:hypothetical protein
MVENTFRSPQPDGCGVLVEVRGQLGRAESLDLREEEPVIDESHQPTPPAWRATRQRDRRLRCSVLGL